MLYLVATPIGNLGDISQRAIDTLKAVDLIASEDTRKTGRLLKLLEIGTPQISYYEHNEGTAVGRIMSALEQGRDVAVVTSAGTPGIADPGYTVVQEALSRDLEFTMVPGASALIMAVVMSGLPVHSFVFRGFTPRKPGKRKRFFSDDVACPYTLIYYESPHRLVRSLRDALDVFGDRRAALANDLTKMYERVWRGTLSELLAEMEDSKIQGEFILVIEGDPDGGWQVGSHGAESG